jgi:hypothetical protein
MRQPIFKINAGDTFNVLEGCDHTFTRCISFHGSSQAYTIFGGQPDVPVPETAIG